MLPVDPRPAGGLAGREAPRPQRRDGCGTGDGRRVRGRAASGLPGPLILRPRRRLRAALHDQPTFAGPAPDPPASRGLPRDLNDHPRYRVVAALGTGGMGTVYRAEHRLMDRPVALKVIRGDLLGNAALVERFRREVKSAARLASHPNIVAAYDAEQAGEMHMLVMEFVEGTDLARWSIAAGRCRSARRASTPARRRWACSTPSRTGWSTATSSRRT